jgi:glycosyltransferase involved in cell wall biosynthesis
MPLVSVIMPSYNYEGYISEAIESVLNQTFNDFELIIIDDASKDNSKKIIQSFDKKNIKIRSFFHKKNQGLAKTVNECIKKAKGKYISYFSSDDIWSKEKLEKQLEILEKDEDLIVWSEGLIVDAKSDFTGELFTQIHSALNRKKSGDIFEELLKNNYICGQSLIYKRENLKNVRFDEHLKYLGDYKFIVDLAKEYKFYFIPEPLVMYRIHGRNTIFSDRIGWKKEDIRIRNYFLQEYGDEISYKVKGRILLNISKGYSYIGEKEKAKQNIYQAMKCNPFYWANLFTLIFILPNRDGIIYNFLNFIYQYYRKVKKWFNNLKIFYKKQ